jgi:hypothetical protein
LNSKGQSLFIDPAPFGGPVTTSTVGEQKMNKLLADAALIIFIVICSTAAMWSVAETIGFIHSLDLYSVYVYSGSTGELVGNPLAFMVMLAVFVAYTMVAATIVVLAQPRIDRVFGVDWR